MDVLGVGQYGRYFILAALASVGLILLIGLVKILVSQRAPRRVPGRVSGVVGAMGSGKSLFVVSRAILPALKRGEYVVTNFDMDIPPGLKGVHRTLDTPMIFEELAERGQDAVAYARAKGRGWNLRDVSGAELAQRGHVANCLVVLDEAHIYAPSSKMVLTDTALWWTTHCRKLGIELYWVTQFPEQIAKGMRRNTAEVWQARRRGGKTFGAKCYPMDKWDKQNRGKPLDSLVYRLTPDVMKLYDSFELIAPEPTPTQRREMKGKAS